MVYNQYLKKRKNPDANQRTVTSFLQPSPSGTRYSNTHPVQTRLSKSLVADCIVGCGLPISIVEQPSFIRFLAGLDPKFHPPSRLHITTKLLPELHQSVMHKVQSHLANAAAVSLTLDVWTDRRQHSYFGVTAHTFINCTPQSLLIGFSAFKGSHTGVRIAAELDKVTYESGIKDKVVHCLCDNASNMRKAFEVLEHMADDNDNEDPDDGNSVVADCLDDEQLWNDLNDDDAADMNQSVSRLSAQRLSCFAHSLQLVVHDGLRKLLSARGIQSKCSKLANIVHQSALFKNEFEKKFGSGRSIPATNSTRWNSVHHQLSCIARLDEVKLQELLQETGHPNLIFTSRDSSSLQELVNILDPFAEVTELVQSDQVPTLGCVVPSIVSLYNLMTDFSAKASLHAGLVRALLESLTIRFRGLLERIHLVPESECISKPYSEKIYLIASVLDPLYGFIWLDVDHRGSLEVKRRIKESIISKSNHS